MSAILEFVRVTKIGFGGIDMRFHPSHDMGALFCRDCGAWGFDLRSNPDRRRALRPCPSRRNIEAIGL